MTAAARGGMDIMPSQDAIAEFTMMTSNYPPDYGISSGATMSLSLKSGTQKFHGEAVGVQPHARLRREEPHRARLARPTFTTTSTASTSAARCTFPRCTTPTSRRPSSSGTRSGARFLQAPAPPTFQHLPDADRPTAGTDLTYVAPAFASSTQL